ncbi:histidine phosphatase family protein [uncultured Campylobacter sp.]|uniref:SixA phosphatase family protein n=1 Tax=uncultured Campylobacter sp. TaxID=218934 RepID=UPI002620460E|nr:histidine phosphatase family protein [uncultured Campylobacter sp.]
MKRIYFIRHAEAQSGGKSDFERALSQVGELCANKLGEKLRSLGLMPDLIITSSAIRALHTAQIIANALDATKKIALLRELYDASLWDLAKFIRSLDEIRFFGCSVNVEKYNAVGLSSEKHRDANDENSAFKSTKIPASISENNALSCNDVEISSTDVMRNFNAASAECVFIVGHNPTIGAICSLLGEKEVDKFSPCSICGLEFDVHKFSDITDHSGKMVMLQCP